MSAATHNFDTFAAAEELQAAGLEPGQARAISQIIGRSREVDPTLMESIESRILARTFLITGSQCLIIGGNDGYKFI